MTFKVIDRVFGTASILKRFVITPWQVVEVLGPVETTALLHCAIIGHGYRKHF